MSRRAVVLPAVLLLAVLAVPIVLVATAGSPTVAPAADASYSTVPSERAEGGDITFTPADRLEEAGWFRVGADPRQFPAHLQVGTMTAGVTFDAELGEVVPGPAAVTGQRVVAGIVDGVVVVIEDDGRTSRLLAVVAATGDSHHLLESDDVILDAVVGRREVFFVTANRRMGDLTGAWRLGIGLGQVPRPVEHMVGSAPETRLVAVSRFVTRLMISPGGSTLGLLHCVELDCRLDALRVDDWSAVGTLELRRGSGEVFAITDRYAVVRPDCPDGPECVPGLIDLATGEHLPMPIDRWEFYSEALIASDGGPVLATQTAGLTAPQLPFPDFAEPPGVTIIDLAQRRAIAHHAPELGSLRILPADDYGVGVDLPPGWILAHGSEPGELDVGIYAMNVESGEIVPLPALGRVLVQG